MGENFDPFHLPQPPTSTLEISVSQFASAHFFVHAPAVVRVRLPSWNVNTRLSAER